MKARIMTGGLSRRALARARALTAVVPVVGVFHTITGHYRISSSIIVDDNKSRSWSGRLSLGPSRAQNRFCLDAASEPARHRSNCR